nr:protein NUCLEAR FUSION DEFECTIVE 4-like [Ipomoea trifida]
MALRWLSLVAAIWLQSVSGTNSNFPVYSPRLKQLLSISQVQLNHLAFANDVGKVFVLTALAGNSICWINTVSYIVAIQNFPLDRQVAVGISTSYVGLSAKIFTDMVEVSFPTESAHGYLLLNSVLPLIVAVVASPIAREINNGVSRRLGRGFTVMFAVTIATGVYAVITTILVPIMELYQKECPTIRPRDQVSDRHGVEEAVSSDSVMGIEGGEVTEEEPSTIVVVEEVEAKDLVKRGDFWLYYMVYFLGATLGLVYLNNLGQIAESRGFSHASILVSVSSSFGFFGRLLPSLYDYFFSM